MSEFCTCGSPHCTDANVKPRTSLDALAAGIASDILESDWFKEHDRRIRAEAWDEGFSAKYLWTYGPIVSEVPNPYRNEP